MKHKFSTTVRMSAAEWSVDIEGVGKFDLRSMDRNQRGKFHGIFMSSFRKLQRSNVPAVEPAPSPQPVAAKRRPRANQLRRYAHA